MSFDFAPAAVPANPTGRESEPNPFDGIVGELAAAHKAGRSDAATGARTFSLPYKTDEDKGKAQNLLRKLGRAGNAHGVTVRKSTSEDAKKGTLSVTFWVRDRIAHKDAAGSAPEPVAAE